MKQNQNARKQRGRSAPRKGGKGSNSGPGNRSNEPKVRGNPKQLLEKYKNQAREAKQAGDRVQAEYFYQFADHYQRVLNEVTARNGGQNQRDQNQRDSNQSDDDQHDDNAPQQEAEQAPRRGRGRRKAADDQAAPASAAEVAGDPAVADQPVEVHPDLDLDGTAVEEKPKRRRAPARRRSPKADVAPEVAADAPAEAGGSPEGNEAA
ncbi:DUF4167 domain-containing protein [Kordiimonas lacus]|uniref:DUF4167 domain-containing protein n=1 Tax=Kordiimonas lacus TaxID=637679 RepID=A0A1G6UQ58_9PROT|nr:DUF4167 domain-containing protein [Kordiimonas lacus]SDD43472.1 protein of unknown function [Kordiimonas lacus]